MKPDQKASVDYDDITSFKTTIMAVVMAAMGRGTLFVFALVFVIGMSSWIIVSRIDDGAKIDIGKSLKTALDSSHLAVRNQFDNQIKTAIIWASLSHIQEAAIELSGLPTDVAVLVNSRPQKNLRKWLAPLFRTTGHRGFFLIGKGNINLASSRDNNVGVVNLLTKQGDILNKVWAGETLISLPQVSDVPLRDINGEMVENLPTMFVATPIKGSRGEVISILAFRIDPAKLFLPIFHLGRFGDSGETYAFNRKGLLISESRFKDKLRQIGLLTSKQSELNVEIRDPGANLVLGERAPLPRDRQPLTRMAKSATDGESGSDLEGYRDYRGVPVVGAWVWDDKFGFGIATEVDVDEAYFFSKNMRFFIVAFSALCIGIVIVLAIVSSRARNRIAMSEERFRAIFVKSSEPFVLVDTLNGHFLDANEEACRLLGYSYSELLNTDVSAIHPHNFKELMKFFDDVERYGKYHTDALSCRTKGGDLVPTEISASSIFIDGEQRLLIHIHDVTEKKRTNEALRDSKERFKDFAETSSDWFWEMDENLKFTYFSKRYAQISRFDPQERIGTSRLDLLPKEELESNPEKWANHQADLEARRPIRNFEYTSLATSSGLRYVLINGKPIFGANGNFLGYRGTGTDITKRKQLETQLAQSQKMEAIGQLTGGVAHDFNNLLAIIMGSIELAGGAEGLDDEMRASLNLAMSAVDKGARLTDQLLAFSRKQTLNPETVAPNSLLFDTISLLQRALGEDIDIKTAFETHLPLIKVDTGLLGNAILNMANNSRDAMPKGGTLTIKTSIVEFDSEVLNKNQAPLRGTYVLISIVDTGEGIQKEDLEHVVEPFFTTKDVGKGTGLGLSMVHGFVNQSDGQMTIDSKRGEGTTINLYFPAADNMDEEKVESASISKTTTTGTETILVVEDDDEVRGVTVKMLDALGYQVFEAEDGPSALKLLKKNGKNVDLVFTDVVMPSGMSGIDLAKELKRHYQDIRVLMTSGYPDKAIKKDTSFTILAKPYKKAQLAEAIRGTLDH